MERVRIEKRGRGRPKGQTQIATDYDRRSLSALARTYTEEAINTLAAVMRNKDEAGTARLAAANYILDRGYGKAPQSHELSGPNQSPMMMMRLDAQILSRLPDDTLIALQALISGLSKGDLATLAEPEVIDSDAYEVTLQ